MNLMDLQRQQNKTDIIIAYTLANVSEDILMYLQANLITHFSQLCNLLFFTNNYVIKLCCYIQLTPPQQSSKEIKGKEKCRVHFR